MKSIRRLKFFILFGAIIVLAGIYFASLKNQSFSKRQFDINSKFYLTQSYPSELVKEFCKSFGIDVYRERTAFRNFVASSISTEGRFINKNVS